MAKAKEPPKPSNPHVNVYLPGTPVSLYQASDPPTPALPALVVDVSIKSPHDIQYKVVWWVGNDRKEQWVNYYEVLPHNQSKSMRIGFMG